jgi:hypothetical protein
MQTLLQIMPSGDVYGCAGELSHHRSWWTAALASSSAGRTVSPPSPLDLIWAVQIRSDGPGCRIPLRGVIFLKSPWVSLFSNARSSAEWKFKFHELFYFKNSLSYL